jgi:hypothetical protein
VDGAIAQYAFRRSALEQERTYTLFPDRLVVTEGATTLLSTPLVAVRRVRLKYEHTKQRAYYQCHLYFGTQRLVLRHVHWQSFGRFEDRRLAYTPFIRALLAQLAPIPNIRYQAGSMANFIAAIVGLPLMATLGVVAFMIGSMVPGVLAIAMIVLCLVMLGPSRPRKLDPLAPPEDLLP